MTKPFSWRPRPTRIAAPLLLVLLSAQLAGAATSVTLSGVTRETCAAECKWATWCSFAYFEPNKSPPLCRLTDDPHADLTVDTSRIFSKEIGGYMEPSDVGNVPLTIPTGLDCSSTGGWGTIHFYGGGDVWSGTYTAGYKTKPALNLPDSADSGEFAFRFDWTTMTGIGNWRQPSIGRGGTFENVAISRTRDRLEITFDYTVTEQGDVTMVSAGSMSGAGSVGSGSFYCDP